ncbi:MAG: ClpXP protease specificity-enhancing factor [Burkholderiales bacterium]
MANAEISTKPYLLRALYEWCVDNGYTAHLAVKVDSRSQVPSEYVRNGEITLNVSPSAVHKLQMGNELIEFSARFAGVARQISVPVAGVYALYARETGQGMTFDVDAAKPALQTESGKEPANGASSNESGPAALPVPLGAAGASPTEPTKPTGGKPQLRRIK